MNEIIIRNYRSISIVLAVLAMVLSFLIGYEQGRLNRGEGVILACTDEVLSALQVPLDQFPVKSNNVADQENSFSVSSEGEVAGVTTTAKPGKFVGSKNGTKYYKPDCATVKRIKEENYIWFSNESDAKLQGYTAGKC